MYSPEVFGTESTRHDGPRWAHERALALARVTDLGLGVFSFEETKILLIRGKGVKAIDVR